MNDLSAPPNSSRQSDCHACAVALAGHGVLIEGESGSGKTSLAFGLIEAARRRGLAAGFVADDRVVLKKTRAGLIARAPAAIAGMAEVGGYGIVAVDHIPQTRIDLVGRLVEDGAVERMPEPADTVIEGVKLPLLLLPRRHEAQSVRIVLAWLSARLGFAL